MTAISVNNLIVERGDKTVLRDLSFTIGEGEIFALLGGNGAGKSTTLLTLLGFISPVSGSANILGDDIGSALKKIRSNCAYLPEAATLYGHLSAYENLEYFLSLAKIKTSKPEMDDVLDVVALQAGQRGETLSSYSKGMRQKVAIALALLRNTPVLLMDEPTSGLDPLAIDEFNQLVRKLAKDGRTILMVTHDVYGACQVADRIGLLRDGKFVGLFEAETDALIDTTKVHAAFADGARI